MSNEVIECEKEPIHIPGLIQPHGLLAVVSGTDGRIEQLSDNTLSFFGRPADELLGTSFSDLLQRGPDFVAFLADVGPDGSFSHLANLRHDGRAVEIVAHIYEGCLILEIQPYVSNEIDFHKIFNHVGRSISKIQDSRDLLRLCSTAVEEVRCLIGYDRVMLYRFDESWNGTVIAESLRNDTIFSYLHHRFPASDIPAQAREMFYLNWLRSIPTVDFAPARIVPTLNPRTGKPLNLSKSYLRSPSPVHLEYLRNMEVGGTLTISILNEGKLWGLIACHNLVPKQISHSERTACQFLGQALSSMVSSREVIEDYEYSLHLKKVTKDLLSFMGKDVDFVTGLIKNSPNLLDLTSATGAAAAIFFEGRWTVIGKVPRIDEINNLVHWLSSEHPRLEVFHTESLPTLYPEALRYKDIACGLLAISIPKSDNNYVLWFRPEVVQTVIWAGNPEKSVQKSGTELRLHPRKSFEAWRETVKLRSLPWKRVEIESACTLRSSIIEHDLERQFLKEQQARQETELEKKRVSFLAQASLVLSSTLDFDQTLQSISKLSTSHFADWCSIFLKDEASVYHVKNISHADPQGQRLAREYVEVFSDLAEMDALLRHTDSGHETLFIEMMTQEWMDKVAENSNYRDLLEYKIGVRSMLIVPLILREEKIGFMQFMMAESQRRFTQSDVALAEELSRRASMAIDNARLHHQTQKLLQAATVANDAKEEVLAIASHDLKNPIAAILLSVELSRRIARQGDSLKSLKSYESTLNKVAKSAKHMDTMIRDLLDIAKIESDELPMEKKETFAEDLINDTYDLFESLAQEKGIILQKHIEILECKILCDKERMLQVFSNLVGNALKFTPAGGKVTISLDVCDKVPKFSIRDTGTGIEEHHILHVFDRFWQAKNTAKQGTGLGLAISKGIIDAHGGKIWLESKLGVGTVFHFTIPSNC